MTDLREGQGRDKKDRGLFASARKLARAAVTRAIERLTGMPLSGDPWEARGLLEDPKREPSVPAAAAAAPAAASASASASASAAASASASASARSAPVVPMAPAAATTVKVAAPPVVPVAPARAGTVPGVGPAAPTPARIASASTPPPAQTIVMTPRAASSPRPATGGLPSPAPGKPAPLPTNGSNGSNGSKGSASAASAASAAAIAAPEPQAEKEPLGILDFEETPETYGVDECAVIARDPNTLFVYWEVTPGAWDRARGALGGEGVLTLRLFVSSLDAHGPRHDFTHDTRLTWDHGRRYVEAPARNARISIAVGLLGADGRFVAMAYGPPTLVPSGAVSAEAAEEWMDVAPAGPPGASRVPPRIRALGTAAQVAAQMAASGRASRRAAGARAGASGTSGVGGKGRLLPSGLYEFDDETSASSWPTSRSRAAGADAWPSSPGGSSPSPTSPGKVRS